MRMHRVLRGQVRGYSIDGAKRLIVADGDLNTAWRVTRFEIAPQILGDAGAGAYDCYGVLATSDEDDCLSPAPVTNIISWRWQDRRQVAWTSSLMSGDSGVYPSWLGGLIDPQHFVLEDLYIAITALQETSNLYYNYFIELERVILDDNQAIMALISEGVAND